MNSRATALLRSTHPILVISDNHQGVAENIEKHSFQPILGSKRPVFILGDKRGFSETNKCAFFLEDSTVHLKELLEEKVGLPVPIKIVNMTQRKIEQEVSRAMQDVIWKRTLRVRELSEKAIKLNEENPPRKELEHGHTPLRILFLSSMFSSVLRYMNRDIAQGFIDCGHEVRIVEEAHGYERKSDIPIYETYNEFKPHVIWLMDHTRASIGGPGAFRNTYVCSWIQDDLPHLWHPQAVSQLSPFDFMLSMFPKMSEKLARHGYPKVYNFPVAANDKIFYPGEPKEEFKCDIAFPCNIGAAATAANPERLQRRMDPILWAIEMGLNVKLWGDGWELFPEVSKGRWMGPIENGPALADVYRSAKFTMHANSDTNMHQRVFEAIACMSLPLVYALPHDEADFGVGTPNMILSTDSHMVRFQDKAEFAAKILYFLKRDDQRASMIYNAYKYSCLGDPIIDMKPVNTYKTRIEELLSEVLNWAPGKTPGH